MPPKLPPDLRAELAFHGFQAACYQPVTLFAKNNRKLPHVPEPGDPWECFLRRPGQFGVVGKAIGATLREAVEAAIKSTQSTGLRAAVSRLETEIEKLTEAMRRAC